jgi:ribosome modulation factor
MFSDKELEGFAQQGYDACFDGDERNECPLEEEYSKKSWEKGWDKAELEIMDEEFDDDEDFFDEDESEWDSCYDSCEDSDSEEIAGDSEEFVRGGES